jgi:hypothetical protein
MLALSSDQGETGLQAAWGGGKGIINSMRWGWDYHALTVYRTAYKKVRDRGVQQKKSSRSAGTGDLQQIAPANS